MSAAHVADTGFLVALGGPENRRYRRVRTFAERNGITFLLPERVYDELTVDGPELSCFKRSDRWEGSSRQYS